MTSDRQDSIDNALAAIRDGKLVIVVDAEDRENEGDFVCAAESIQPETIDLMLRVGRGMLCTPVSGDVVTRLGLQPMTGARRNSSHQETPMLATVDHRDAGTGVSVVDRAKTIRELANPSSVSVDFLCPGHIAPLAALDGGVLRRAGHTEATIDLLHLAGMQPVGVLIELLSDQGHGMADSKELNRISQEYDIPIVTIEALIRYRRKREQLVRREVETDLPTRFGHARLYAYSVQHEPQTPLAIVWGSLDSVAAPLVRMHSSCFTGDLLASLRCDCGDQLGLAVEAISREGTGAIVYLPQEGRGIGLLAKLKAYALQDKGMDTVEANRVLGYEADMRDYMVGLQILKDLGLSQVRLLTNNPKKTEAFPYYGMGLVVVEQVPIIAPPASERRRYLATKRNKLGHALPDYSEAMERNQGECLCQERQPNGR
jgi:3,4-dihydroxy 2-butanone 4-phosphate synthase/GTP cyclohydrolase II